MDTSSYGQGGMAGGILVFPDPFFIPDGTVVTEEQINIPARETTTIYLKGSVVTQVTGDFINGVNQNYPH